MQLRTFSAKTPAQVMALIKEEMGPDAVILDTREEDGHIIMTAALERRQAPAPAENETGEHDMFPFLQMDQPPSGQWQQWHEEWMSIKSHLWSLMKPALKLEQLPPRQRIAIEFLQREGVEDEAILYLSKQMHETPTVSILEPLSRLMPLAPWTMKHWPERMHMVAGPFGVGKTSVAIRMALALRKTNPTLRICLLNADATRGNGRMLLRHYSELSDMGYKEAMTASELVTELAFAEQEGFERIFIDLPGLSRGKYLQDFLQQAGFSEEQQGKVAVHCVLPPHFSSLQMRDIIARYRTTQRGSLVWAKLDEAEHYGQLINVSLATGLPISAFSYGPGLGHTLMPVDDAALWRLLFKRELPLLGSPGKEHHGTQKI